MDNNLLGAAENAGVQGHIAIEHLHALVDALRPAAPPQEPERDIKLKPFESGDANEWLQWRARFQVIARCKGWNDAQQRRALAQSMAGKAIEATKDVRIEADAGNGLVALTAVQSLEAYEAKFITAAGTARARSEFLIATQKQEETAPQWHTRLTTLFRRAHPNVEIETNHEVIERFCLGLWNATVAERTLADRPDNMTEALDLASGHVATLLTMRRRTDGRGSRSDYGLHAIGETSATSSSSAVNSVRGRGKITCFNCGRDGHMQRECSSPRKEGGAVAGSSRSEGGQRNFRSGRGRRGRQGRRFTTSKRSLNALASLLDAALDGEVEEKGSEKNETKSGN